MRSRTVRVSGSSAQHRDAHRGDRDRPPAPRIPHHRGRSCQLRRWLTEPDLSLAFRSASLLRVIFLWPLSREEGSAYLEKFARHNRDRLATLEAIRDNAEWGGDPAQICGRLVLEYGLRGSETAEQWAHLAAEQVNEHM